MLVRGVFQGRARETRVNSIHRTYTFFITIIIVLYLCITYQLILYLFLFFLSFLYYTSSNVYRNSVNKLISIGLVNDNIILGLYFR